MNRQHLLIVGVAALAAIVGAYFLGRSDIPKPPPMVQTDASSGKAADGPIPAEGPQSAARPIAAAATGTRLPEPGTPLKDTFAELQARANAGDAVAATRLFRDLDRCHRLRGSEWKNASATNNLTSNKTEGMSPAQLRTYQMLLDAMELRQKGVREDQELCAGVSDEMLDSLVANIARAARLGDGDARACYLGRGPLYDPRSLLDHPESLRAYRDNAAKMIDAGLSSGDWRVVDLLQRAYEPGSQSLLAGLVGADPVQHYRYLRLYRLGAEQHRAGRLDRQLAVAAANLTSAQIAEANEWTQTTLRNFKSNSTGSTPPGWDACSF